MGIEAIRIIKGNLKGMKDMGTRSLNKDTTKAKTTTIKIETKEARDLLEIQAVIKVNTNKAAKWGTTTKTRDKIQAISMKIREVQVSIRINKALLGANHNMDRKVEGSNQGILKDVEAHKGAKIEISLRTKLMELARTALETEARICNPNRINSEPQETSTRITCIQETI